MLKPYIVYFKYKGPSDKKPGPVKLYRLYADNVEQARQLATQQAGYPTVEVLQVKPA